MDPVGDRSSLLSAAGIATGSCVALIGAGGKTTTMFALAHDLCDLGVRVVLTTTTKIWPPADMPLILENETASIELGVRSALEAAGIVAVGHRLGPSGKLHGISCEQVCTLMANRVAGVILCEADGAAGRSLKAHRRGEPVVPNCATHLLILAGLDVVGRPASEEYVHRLQELRRISGAAPGDPIQPEQVARVLVASSSYAPPGARIVYVFNKADTPEAVGAGDSIARRLTGREESCVVLTRYGRPVAAVLSPPCPSLYSE